jgi:hypothetical protein
MKPALSSASTPVEKTTDAEHRRSDEAIVCATGEAAQEVPASLGSLVQSIRASQARGDHEEAVRLAQFALRDHDAEVALVPDVHYLLSLSLWALRRESEAAKHYGIALQAAAWE